MGEGKLDLKKDKVLDNRKGGTDMELETAFITPHAQMRMKERLGIKNLDRMIRMAALASARGTRIDNARESVAKRMEKHNTSEGTEAVIYNGYYYVFTDNFEVLVTVYPAEKKVAKWMEVNASKSNGYKKCTSRKHEEETELSLFA